MGKLRDIIRQNRMYVLMAVFIALINLIVLAEKFSPKEETPQTAVTSPQDQPAEEEKPDIFSEEKQQERVEKIEQLAEEKPLLYLFLGIANLAAIFLIFVGFLVDGYLLTRWYRKDPVRPRRVSQEVPRWSVGDVVRVTLIFLTFGYIFIILQEMVADYIPLMKNDNFLMVLNTAVMNIVGISVVIYFIVKKYGQNIAAAGISMKNSAVNIFYAAVGYVSLLPVLIVIMLVTFLVIRFFKYQPPVQPIVQVFMEEKATSVLWFSSLFAAIFGPIAEEIFFRGFMYTALKHRIGILGGMLVTSAIFAFLHAHLVGFLPIFALGFLLAYLYEKTGSLVSSISVHIAHNVAMVILVFMVRNIGIS